MPFTFIKIESDLQEEILKKAMISDYVEIVRKTMNPTEAGFIGIPLEKIGIEIRKN